MAFIYRIPTLISLLFELFRKSNLIIHQIKSNQIKSNQIKSNQIKSNQIKSNHFYCHITTAQGPWWVKFLRACSRQCKKNNNNLHMDSTYLQTVQKTMCKIHIHIKTYLVIDTHYTLYVHIYIMYTSIHSIMWRCNRLYIYSRLVVQQIVVQRCNRLCICNVVDVHCMVSSDSRCVMCSVCV